MNSVSKSPVLVASRSILKRNAKTFHLASFFLPQSSLDDSSVVYAFCRIVDDIADSNHLNSSEKRKQLDLVKEEIKGHSPARPLISEFLNVCRSRNIDTKYALELISGVEMDIDTVRIQNDEELDKYCYLVAGTVGLMMSPLLGVQSPKAADYAKTLGMAMQITNICRDVLEDSVINRVYLPASRLKSVGEDPENLVNGKASGKKISVVVMDLLDRADVYYKKADQGFRYIPLRTRFAILIASRVYRAIGVHLRWKGGNPLSGRTIVPGWIKIFWIIRSSLEFFNPKIIGFKK